MPSSEYPQSWTRTNNDIDLKRLGHTVYYRGDGAHHDSTICSKCREEAAKKIHLSQTSDGYAKGCSTPFWSR